MITKRDAQQTAACQEVRDRINVIIAHAMEALDSIGSDASIDRLSDILTETEDAIHHSTNIANDTLESY